MLILFSHGFLQEELAFDHLDRAVVFCEASNLESVLAYIRKLFFSNAEYNVVRTVAENMHFIPVYPLNAD